MCSFPAGQNPLGASAPAATEISGAQARTARVQALVDELFSEADSSTDHLPQAISAALDTVFASNARSFREVLLVASIAMLIDPQYRPSTAFYACNPRPVYELGIKPRLDLRHIPSTKSGPLNIAKASGGLDKSWAARRSPQHVAANVVRLVAALELMQDRDRHRFAVELHRRFLQLAEAVAALRVELDPDAEPTFLYELSRQLIDNAPDSGNTPQHIVGYLLSAYHDSFDTGVLVTGHQDRSSSPSLQSGKPGDVAETHADGRWLTAYEVTVKKFDAQRIREAAEALRAVVTSDELPEVIVLCRPQDVPNMAAKPSGQSHNLGHVEQADVVFRFVDLYSWLDAQLLKLPPDGRLAFLADLQQYVEDFNTSEKVKRQWAASLGMLAAPSSITRTNPG